MREAGDYEGSVDLLQETYERYLGVLGEDFVDTLRTAKSLAVSLQEDGPARRGLRLTEGHRRAVRAHLRRRPPGLARLQAEPRLRPVGARGQGRRPRDRRARCCRSTRPPSAAAHPFTLVGAEQHLHLPARRRLGRARRSGSRTGRWTRCATRSATTTRSRCPARSTRRTACMTCGGSPRRRACSGRRSSGSRRPSATTIPTRYVCEANLAIVLRAQGRLDEAEALQLKVIAGLSRGARHRPPQRHGAAQLEAAEP